MLMHLTYVIETPQFGQNMQKVILKRKKFQISYPAVPYDDLAVPDIFPSGTIGSPKNFITMMLIRHFDRCLHFHD